MEHLLIFQLLGQFHVNLLQYVHHTCTRFCCLRPDLAHVSELDLQEYGSLGINYSQLLRIRQDLESRNRQTKQIQLTER